MSEKQRMIEESKIIILKNMQNVEVIKSAANQFNMSYETFRKKFLWETWESPRAFLQPPKNRNC